MTREKSSPNRIKTTRQVFRIIELLKEEDGFRLTDIANELEMSKSNAHRHISTLEEEEYVVAEGGEYYPSAKFLDIGQYVRYRKPISEMVEPKVEQLAIQTGERSEFLIEEHGKGVFIQRETGENAVHTNSRIGASLPLHAAAAGKAILAFLPAERVDEILETQGLEPRTENTITAEETLREELADIRESSIAYNDQEVIDGLRAVGTPIVDSEAGVLGALSVTGPTHRLEGEVFQQEIPNLLRGAANEIELNFAYA